MRDLLVKAGVRLAAIVGAGAAAILLTITPLEESGRTVDVTIAADGTPTIRHKAGPQYLKAYLDDVGVATACDGITRRVKLGQRYTEAQCAQLLERELVATAIELKRCAPVLWEPGRVQVMIASISLAYNIGWPSFCRSTAARHFRARQWRAGCDAFSMWIKGTIGKRRVVLSGLVKRRAREQARCLMGAAA